MSKSRTPLLLGLVAAGGIGYYLYNAGGDAKAAEKQFESDVHKASANVKSALPGRNADAEKDLKNFGARTGAKVDEAVAETDKQLSKAKSNAEAYAKDARAGAIKKIDELDKKVEDSASKAKSGILSWFGGGSK